jgi:hypothetical protein
VKADKPSLTLKSVARRVPVLKNPRDGSQLETGGVSGVSASLSSVVESATAAAGSAKSAGSHVGVWRLREEVALVAVVGGMNIAGALVL